MNDSTADLVRLSAVRHGFVTTPMPATGGERLRLHHLEFGNAVVGSAAFDSAAFDSAELDRREPVMLVHGVTGHAAAWSGVATRLADGLRPVAVDLRGHGASQWSAAGDYATTTHADDLLAVVDACGFARVSLVGSSWGGLIALAFAAAHPDRVRRLVLVDIEPSFAQSTTDVAARPTCFASQAEVLAFERTRNPNSPEDVLAAVAAASVRSGPGGLEAPFDPYFTTCWPFRDDDWWDALTRIEVPSLVVHAGQSFVRRAVTEQMATILRNGTHVEIAASTHVVPVDAPEALARILNAFLAASSPDAAHP